VPRTASAGAGRALSGRARSMLLPHERNPRPAQEPSVSGARWWRLHMRLR
jgi:hypothetical protein